MKAKDFKENSTIVEIEPNHADLEVKEVFYKHESDELEKNDLAHLEENDCFIVVNYCNRANEAFSYTKKQYLDEQ